jgi:DNA-binding transcriptional regulator YhcF (GntR family)
MPSIFSKAYKNENIKKLIERLEYCTLNPDNWKECTVEGLSKYLNVDRRTINNYTRELLKEGVIEKVEKGKFTFFRLASEKPHQSFEGETIQDIGKVDIGKPDIGKVDMGKVDMGKDDIGKPSDIGKPDIGKVDMGKVDMGKDDIGKVDMGKVQNDTPEEYYPSFDNYTYEELPYVTKYYLRPLDEFYKPMPYEDSIDRVRHLLEKMGWDHSANPPEWDKVGELVAIAGSFKNLANFLEKYIQSHPSLKWNANVNWEILKNGLLEYFKVDVTKFKTYDELEEFVLSIKPGRAIVKAIITEWIEKVGYKKSEKELENIVSRAKKLLSDYRIMQVTSILGDLMEGYDV